VLAQLAIAGNISVNHSLYSKQLKDDFFPKSLECLPPDAMLFYRESMPTKSLTSSQSTNKLWLSTCMNAREV